MVAFRRIQKLDRMPLRAGKVSFIVLAIGLYAFPTLSKSATEEWKSLAPADQRFLEEVQARTFTFFWETTNPRNGLVVDRWPQTRSSSVAGIGFGLTSYCIGVERNYISRDQAIDRVEKTLRFLFKAPQSKDPLQTTGYKGFFYHFLDFESGFRYEERELSSIDTALMMVGVLTCMEYFDRENPREESIRKLANALYRRVQWDWMQHEERLICMSWKPEQGFSKHYYRGYNEAMLLYLFALGSPTYPITADAWDAYTSTYLWSEFYGQEQLNFSPLFGHQFSHAWIDFRDIQDEFMREKGIDYFENSRRATYSQRAYAIVNPQNWKGYGAQMWGLTACGGPGNVTALYNGEQRRFRSYWARGASSRDIRDDGTIAPSAAASSIPFAPEITVPTLQNMRRRYGDRLYTKYGFLDSFNPSFTLAGQESVTGQIYDDSGWINSFYLGIDQGPILLMIENFRTGFLWELMKKNEYLRKGLKRAGFEGGWLEVES